MGGGFGSLPLGTGSTPQLQDFTAARTNRMSMEFPPTMELPTKEPDCSISLWGRHREPWEATVQTQGRPRKIEKIRVVVLSQHCLKFLMHLDNIALNKLKRKRVEKEEGSERGRERRGRK